MAKQQRPQRRGEIVDPAAMRALAHPLKWALMDVLLVEGPRRRRAVPSWWAIPRRTALSTCASWPATAWSRRHRASRRGSGRGAWPRRSNPGRWSSLMNQRPGRRRTGAGVRPARDGQADALARQRHTYPEAWRRAALRAGATTWLTSDEAGRAVGRGPGRAVTLSGPPGTTRPNGRMVPVRCGC